MPKGTIAASAAVLELFNSDYRADATNYERLVVATHAASFEIYTQKAGTGTLRPLKIYTTGNTNQLYLKADGNVGINNGAPAEKLDVDGNINVTGVYKVVDVQVVSAQGVAVADATDAASTMARLNELIARCRAHGLIAT